MANAFDTAAAPQGEPEEITAGDLITWRRDDLVSDYPTAAYSLSYSFQCEAHVGGSKHGFDVTASEDADGYYAQIAGATTLALSHYGGFSWQAYITRTSDSARITIDSGRVVVDTDLASQDNDQRSHAEIMVTKIESILEGRADSDVSSYSIGNRSLTKLGISELTEWRNHYLAEVATERRKLAVKRGKATGQTVGVRF